MSVHLCQPAEVIWCGFEVEKVWLSGFKKEAERLYFSSPRNGASAAVKAMISQNPQHLAGAEAVKIRTTEKPDSGELKKWNKNRPEGHNSTFIYNKC